MNNSSVKEKWKKVKELLEEIKEESDIHGENAAHRILYIVNKFID